MVVNQKTTRQLRNGSAATNNKWKTITILYWQQLIITSWNGPKMRELVKASSTRSELKSKQDQFRQMKIYIQ